MNNNFDVNEVCHCIVDSWNGIYLPQKFAEDYADVSTLNKWQIYILEDGPDNDEYWDTWDDVLDNCILTFDDGNYILHQDTDLFAIREDSAEQYFEYLENN